MKKVKIQNWQLEFDGRTIPAKVPGDITIDLYNAGIVKGIVALAVAEVEGTLPLPNNKNGIPLFLEKDGIYADIAVVVEYGHDVPELAYRIQQSVKQSVENMTHFKVAEVL